MYVSTGRGMSRIVDLETFKALYIFTLDQHMMKITNTIERHIKFDIPMYFTYKYKSCTFFAKKSQFILILYT